MNRIIIERLTYPLPEWLASNKELSNIQDFAEELTDKILKPIDNDVVRDGDGKPMGKFVCASAENRNCLGKFDRKYETGSDAEFILMIEHDDNSSDIWFYCGKCLSRRLKDTIYSI